VLTSAFNTSTIPEEARPKSGEVGEEECAVTHFL